MTPDSVENAAHRFKPSPCVGRLFERIMYHSLRKIDVFIKHYTILEPKAFFDTFIRNPAERQICNDMVVGICSADIAVRPRKNGFFRAFAAQRAEKPPAFVAGDGVPRALHESGKFDIIFTPNPDSRVYAVPQPEILHPERLAETLFFSQRLKRLMIPASIIFQNSSRVVRVHRNAHIAYKICKNPRDESPAGKSENENICIRPPKRALLGEPLVMIKKNIHRVRSDKPTEKSVLRPASVLEMHTLGGIVNKRARKARDVRFLAQTLTCALCKKNEIHTPVFQCASSRAAFSSAFITAATREPLFCSDCTEIFFITSLCVCQ